MKNMILISSLLALTTPAFAYESLHCANGDISKVGDGYYGIDVFEDGLVFMPYEASFTIDAADMTYANGTYTIKNAKTELSVEGEVSQIVVNGTVKISKDDTKLVAKIRIGKGTVQTHKLNCVKK